MRNIATRIGAFLKEEMPVYFNSTEKKSLFTQLGELKKLYNYYHSLPYHYIKHGLFLQAFSGDILDYVPLELLHRYRDKTNPKSDYNKVINKELFSKLLADASIRVVRNFAIIRRDGSIALPNGEALFFEQLLEILRQAGAKGFFLKPTHGGGGLGHYTAKLVGKTLVVNGNIIGDDEELTARLFSKLTTRVNSYLIQPLIRQHPILNKINSSSVNTVRIDTFVQNDNTVVHNAAVLRIGSGSECTDNWGSGGLVCNIDLETGELAEIAVTKAKYGRHTFTSHPVTGIVFRGVHLPFWEETKSLVSSAAEAMRPLRSLGWDVAIMEDGPIIIEANQDYDIFMLQDRLGGLRKTSLAQHALLDSRINPL